MVRSSTRDSCTNQSECRSTQEEGGATESCTKSVRRGQGSIQDRRGNRQLQIHTGRGRDQRTRPPIAKMSTQVQRGRGDARRGMGLQTGSAEAKRAAATSVRSICNLFIWISSGALTRGGLARRPEPATLKNGPHVLTVLQSTLDKSLQHLIVLVVLFIVCPV